MTNFKQFLESSLGTKLNRFYQDLDAKVGGAFLSSDVSGTEDFAKNLPHLPSTDLTIPSSVKTGRIVVLDRKSNPIRIRLSDGTEANFTWDEFQKIKGAEPTVGKVMTITFQRHPDDRSRNLSKINHVVVHD